MTLTPSTAPPMMDRCECAEVSFEEVARRMRTDDLSLEDVARRMGCGETCTACIADLRRYVGGR